MDEIFRFTSISQILTWQSRDTRKMTLCIITYPPNKDAQYNGGLNNDSQYRTTTFSIMTFSLMTFSKATISIMTFSIIKFSISTLRIMTLSLTINKMGLLA